MTLKQAAFGHLRENIFPEKKKARARRAFVWCDVPVQ